MEGAQKKKKRGQKEGAKEGGIKKRSPYRKKGVTNKKMGFKKKKEGVWRAEQKTPS